MKNKRLATLVLILALVALITAAFGLFYPSCPIPEAVIQWVTNWTGIEVDTPSGSTHVALDVDQVGSGDIISLKDGGTEVFDIPDGGIADFKANAPTNLGNAGTDFTSTGGLLLAGNLTVSPGASNTVIAYATAITPLTSSLVITAASTITNATMAACTVNGQLVVIAVAAGSSDITITESSTLYAGGSIALDASEFDAVALMCVGSKWRKIAAFGDN